MIHTMEALEGFYGLDLNRNAMCRLKDCQEVWVELMGEQGESARDTHVVRVICC